MEQWGWPTMTREPVSGNAEPVTEPDGEPCVGSMPFARQAFPLCHDVLQRQIDQLCGRRIAPALKTSQAADHPFRMISARMLTPARIGSAVDAGTPASPAKAAVCSIASSILVIRPEKMLSMSCSRSPAF